MLAYEHLAFRVEPMRSEDIPEVMQIEHVAFSAPWSARAYDYELHYNEMAHYYVARPQLEWAHSAPAESGPPGGNGQEKAKGSLWERLFGHEKKAAVTQAPERSPIVGYGGWWLMVDEAHISTLASHPEWRRKGIGELLLLAMIDSAAEIGAQLVTLEVRVTNQGAQELYRKYGFQVAGMRKGYYSDNGEDAYIMTTPPITTAQYVRRLQALKTRLFEHLSR